MNPDPKRKRNPLKRGWVRRLRETNEIAQKNLPYAITPSKSPFQSIKKRSIIERLKKDPYYEKIIESKTVQDLAMNLGMKLFRDIPTSIRKTNITKMPLKERIAIYSSIAPEIENERARTAFAIALELDKKARK